MRFDVEWAKIKGLLTNNSVTGSQWRQTVKRVEHSKIKSIHFQMLHTQFETLNWHWPCFNRVRVYAITYPNWIRYLEFYAYMFTLGPIQFEAVNARKLSGHTNSSSPLRFFDWWDIKPSHSAIFGRCVSIYNFSRLNNRPRCTVCWIQHHPSTVRRVFNVKRTCQYFHLRISRTWFNTHVWTFQVWFYEV